MSADTFPPPSALRDLDRTADESSGNGQIAVREAQPDDVDSLALLAQELLAFYGLPARNQRSYMAHVMTAELFERESNLKILVSETMGTVSGFLAYTEVFAFASCQRSFFIQDLFVTRKARSSGVGAALMGELLRLADETNVAQIDWTADPWNEKAVAFYEKLGPLLKSDKILYRLAGPALRQSVLDQKR
ncbi:GNAT family N-acetyltransferase [Nisaea acidiphila]|uniref:GNAT family N-acetyltransferase n=1 Tax=Nisaea acidiphila TaxID=1862145 RepID=UPI0035670BD8